jgi:hypothetical protein
MAPGALVEQNNLDGAFAQGKFRNDDAPRDLFPDGIRTSGQHPPLYDVLRPYAEFPKEIEGPTVWRREDYVDHPDRWTHRFTPEEVEELGAEADKFIASGTPLTGISKVSAASLPLD